MTHGLKIFNENQFLQIGDTSPILRVAQTGTQTSYYPAEQPALTFPSVTYVNSGYLLAIRPTDLTKYVISDYNYNFAYNGMSIYETGDIASYKYCLLYRGGWSSPSGYGLVVKNASSQIVFNSSDSIFVITGKITIPVNVSTYNAASTTVDIPIPANAYGKDIYMITSQKTYGVIKYDSTRAKLLRASVRILSNTLIRVDLYATISTYLFNPNRASTDTIEIHFGVPNI